MGPTASGKTGMAVELVQRFAFDIINVDSAQVYRGMDIGTGKPDRATLSEAPHRLLDIKDPSEPYSASDFRVDALHEIAHIFSVGKLHYSLAGLCCISKCFEMVWLLCLKLMLGLEWRSSP